MTSHVKTGNRPEIGRYYGFDHLVFWVGNAKQAASYYVTRCKITQAVIIVGFTHFGYKGLEVGHRDIASHAVSQNGIVFVFQSPYNPSSSIHDAFQSAHGDAVKGNQIFTEQRCCFHG